MKSSGKPRRLNPHPDKADQKQRRRGAARRLHYLGLEKLSPELRARRSCVMIQIDGLSFQNLRQALKRRRLPFLARMLHENKMIVAPWRAMLPSSTSAFQAG